MILDYTLSKGALIETMLAAGLRAGTRKMTAALRVAEWVFEKAKRTNKLGERTIEYKKIATKDIYWNGVLDVKAGEEYEGEFTTDTAIMLVEDHKVMSELGLSKTDCRQAKEALSLIGFMWFFKKKRGDEGRWLNMWEVNPMPFAKTNVSLERGCDCEFCFNYNDELDRALRQSVRLAEATFRASIDDDLESVVTSDMSKLAKGAISAFTGALVLSPRRQQEQEFEQRQMVVGIKLREVMGAGGWSDETYEQVYAALPTLREDKLDLNTDADIDSVMLTIAGITG